MLDKLKRLFSKPISTTNTNFFESPIESQTSNTEAAKVYKNVLTQLMTAKGFHVVHEFTYDVKHPRDYKYRLEGAAVPWKFFCIFSFPATPNLTANGSQNLLFR